MIPKYYNSYAGFVYSYPVVVASFAGVESGFLNWNMISNCYISRFHENLEKQYYLVVGTTLAVVIMGFAVVANLNILKQITLTWSSQYNIAYVIWEIQKYLMIDTTNNKIVVLSSKLT